MPTTALPSTSALAAVPEPCAFNSIVERAPPVSKEISSSSLSVSFVVGFAPRPCA